MSIAAEVVALPSLLFVDEATTSLDAYHSLNVLRMLRRLSRGEEREGGWGGGMTIVCSVHQPSRRCFGLFDSLLLLRQGGKTVFCGPVGLEGGGEGGREGVVSYFEGLPGSPRLGPGENPATWMLECIGAGTISAAAMGGGKGGWEGGRACGGVNHAELYSKSALCAAILAEVQHLEASFSHPSSSSSYSSSTTTTTTAPLKPSSLLLHFSASRPPSFGTQLYYCTLRAWRTSWRLPSYQWARLGGSSAMALVLASVYHRQRQENVSDLVGYLGLVFIMLTFTACVNSTSVLELIHQERPSFNRERFAGSYSVGAYALSWLLVEIPYVIVQSSLFLNILYFYAHFSRDVWRVSWFWAFLFLYMLFATAFGQALAAVTPSTQTAQTFYNTLAPIFSIMSGMTFMPSDIPRGWLALWVLCPLNKAFEGVVMTQWWEDGGGGGGGRGGEEATIIVFNSVTRTFEKRTRWGAVQWFFGEEEGRENALGFSFGHRWRNLWVLVVFVAGCNILFMCALKWRRFERR